MLKMILSSISRGLELTRRSKNAVESPVMVTAFSLMSANKVHMYIIFKVLLERVCTSVIVLSNNNEYLYCDNILSFLKSFMEY